METPFIMYRLLFENWHQKPAPNKWFAERAWAWRASSLILSCIRIWVTVWRMTAHNTQIRHMLCQISQIDSLFYSDGKRSQENLGYWKTVIVSKYDKYRKRTFQYVFKLRVWCRCAIFKHPLTGSADTARWRWDASDTGNSLKATGEQASWRHTAWRHNTQLGDRLRGDVSSDVMVRVGESVAWQTHVSAVDGWSVRRWWVTAPSRRMEVHTWVGLFQSCQHSNCSRNRFNWSNDCCMYSA